MVYCPGKLTNISDYHALYHDCKEKTNLDHSIKKTHLFFLEIPCYLTHKCSIKAINIIFYALNSVINPLGMLEECLKSL